jgi:hypothetical protein
VSEQVTAQISGGVTMGRQTGAMVHTAPP